MAYKLEDLTNVIPPSAPFTKGRMRDDDGTRNGTPINEQLLGDMTQFFAKMMDEAGVTPSGSADNQNTNQLFESLTLIPNSYVGETLITSPFTDPGLPSGYTGFVINTTVAIINLPGSISDDVVSFKTSMPVGTSFRVFISAISGSFDLVINSTNLGGDYTKPIQQVGISSNDTVVSISPGSAGEFFTVTVFENFFLLQQE